MFSTFEPGSVHVNSNITALTKKKFSTWPT